MEEEGRGWRRRRGNVERLEEDSLNSEVLAVKKRKRKKK